MVIATKDIINNKTSIRTVYHDQDDGVWQFLDGADVSESTAVIVGLKEIVDLDKSIEKVHDLPLGWVAWREEKGKPWFRRPEEENDG